MTKRWTGPLAGLLAGILVLIAVRLSPTLFGLENLAYDEATRLVSRDRRPDPRIVIVAISETTTHALEEQYGRWPYSRAVMALVVDELQASGARVIVFDQLFAQDRDRTAGGARCRPRRSSTRSRRGLSDPCLPSLSRIAFSALEIKKLGIQPAGGDASTSRGQDQINPFPGWQGRQGSASGRALVDLVGTVNASQVAGKLFSCLCVQWE